MLHELVTTCNRHESRALQGKVTKRYKEELQCYKLVSLCVTRKFEVKKKRDRVNSLLLSVTRKVTSRNCTTEGWMRELVSV